ncbi:MAG: hypothetical protein NWE98_01550 [Candidatus Bathyarchaeota archaeon]|nr:hypothetical protein [Candidatus Bathyarchaeota archaeon]
MMVFSGIEFRILESIFSGIIVALAFPIGALIAIFVTYSAHKRALFAAFGAGIFLATIMLLVEQSLILGNVLDLLLGFSLGATAYGLAQHYIRHRLQPKFNKSQKLQNQGHPEGKLSVIGAILDSVPETLFIGIIIALHEPGLSAAITVLFLGNLATTLEGAKIMHKQGIGRKKIFRDWLIDFAIVAVAAPVGYFLAKAVIQDFLAAVLSFASGTLIVFIAGELISRAYRESTGHMEDLSLSIGFLLGVTLLFVL